MPRAKNLQSYSAEIWGLCRMAVERDGFTADFSSADIAKSLQMEFYSFRTALGNNQSVHGELYKQILQLQAKIEGCTFMLIHVDNSPMAKELRTFLPKEYQDILPVASSDTKAATAGRDKQEEILGGLFEEAATTADENTKKDKGITDQWEEETCPKCGSNAVAKELVDDQGWWLCKECKFTEVF